jgi:tRNA1Val (adenine37-N6)-methyltransferase
MLGIEIQKELFGLALKNRTLNNVEDQIDFRMGDITKLASTLKKTPFSVVVSNPPYTKKGSGRTSPGYSRFVAR